jgi:hypothetical protein
MIATETQQERAMQAETARYTSLGLFYAAGAEQSALAAQTARYEGLAEFYGANTQRAIAAEMARYKGLGEFYGVEENTLAWPPRPTQLHPVENTVMSLDGLAVYHQSEWGSTPIKANTDGDKGLMEFFAAKNEIVVPVDDNALAVYHQSERELVPIVTGVPQTHDREYGLARFDIPGNETQSLAWPPRPTQFQGNAPVAIETGADGDIGLMDFYTPEE